MVEIKNLDEISREKLENLFKIRGHGIMSPLFWTNLKKVSNDPEFAIFQCNCGEIIIIKRNMINKLSRDEDGDILCKVCGKYEHITESFKNKIINLFLAEIFTDIYRSKSEGEALFHFNRARNEAMGIIPINNPSEFAIGLAFHLETTTIKRGLDLNNKWNKAINPLFKRALTINPTHISKWYLLEESIKSRQELYKRERIYLNGLWRISEIENYPFEDKKDMKYGTLKPVAPLETKIRHLMTSYKEFFEISLLPDFIMNLILITEGKDITTEPFKGRKYSQNGKTKNVNSDYTTDKISFLVHNDNVNDELKELLKVTYNNKIRNDEAHSQYHIDLSNKTIFSEKYKHTYSFTYIENLVKDINKAELLTEKLGDEGFFDVTKFPHHPLQERMGIYRVSCFLDEDSEPNVDIHQFFYFNPNKKIFDLAIKTEEQHLEIIFANSFIILEYNDQNRDFLISLLNFKSIKLNLIGIAPSLQEYEEFRDKQKYPERIVVNGKEFFVKYFKRKEQTIPEETINVLKTKLSLS